MRFTGAWRRVVADGALDDDVVDVAVDVVDVVRISQGAAIEGRTQADKARMAAIKVRMIVFRPDKIRETKLKRERRELKERGSRKPKGSKAEEIAHRAAESL